MTWLFDKLYLGWLLDGVLSLPIVGGNSLSVSYIGTFLVFVYIWLPLHDPADAGRPRARARPISSKLPPISAPRRTQTFRTVLLPLALPGIVAGSIFTFSLTLGDYIIPQIIGSSRLFIGQAVYAQQGTAGNVPLAAAFSVVPIVIMAIYLCDRQETGELSMRSDRGQHASLALKIAAACGLAFPASAHPR